MISPQERVSSTSSGRERSLREFVRAGREIPTISAEIVGISRPALTNSLRLLSLPDEVLDTLSCGDITAGHARALLGMTDKDGIVDTAKKILTHSLTVRDTEELVKKLNKEFESNNKENEEEKSQEGTKKVNYAKDLARKVSTLLDSRKVVVSDTKKNKFIQIEFKDNDDLQKILIKLCGKEIEEEF